MGKSDFEQKQKILQQDAQIPLSQIGRGVEITLIISETECADWAQRLGILSLKSIKGDFFLKMLSADRVLAKGHLKAALEQACIITSEPVFEEIDEDFMLRFIPEAQMPQEDEIFDLEALLEEEADDLPHDGRKIDLEKALYEQLALCLNPYPRKEGSGLNDFVDYTPHEDETGEDSEENGKRNPFSVLKELKERGKIS